MKSIIKTSIFGLLIVSNLAHAVCPQWSASKKTGLLDSRLISEASGLVVSHLQSGKLIWTNDSGGASSLFATSLDGKTLKTVNLSNFSNTDFEALALGPCPANIADSCIYVGDIGDGIGWRSSFKVGVFKESDFWASSTIKAKTVLNFSYPGNANNAEAMLVTPDGQILIFTKTEGSTEVFFLDFNSKVSRVIQVDLKGILGQARGKAARITDANLSKDGDKVLLLSYGDILEVNLKSLTTLSPKKWVKGVDYSVAKGPGLAQQETIAYNSESSFIVASEAADGAAPEIHTYTCR